MMSSTPAPAANGATRRSGRAREPAPNARPAINIAGQQVATSASLEGVRERSNVGERVQTAILENLIARNLKSELEPIPGRAESWKRIDERTVELSLRKGVKFHNGDEMTSEDVVFTFGPERMFGTAYDNSSNKTLFTTVLARDSIEGKKLPAEVIGIAKRTFPSLEKVEAVDKYTVRFVNRVPDVTLEARIGSSGCSIISKRGFLEARTWIDWARTRARARRWPRRTVVGRWATAGGPGRGASRGGGGGSFTGRCSSRAGRGPNMT